MKSVLAFSLLLLCISTSGAQSQQPRITGFFTDMHYVDEAGDLVGFEVWIAYARGHYYATIQVSDGEPDPPAVVRVEVSGAQIKFESAGVHYVGTINKSGLMLSINSNSPILLKRGMTYWQVK